jgi:diguanylate cyclase (GGDEF)-like protein
MTVMRRRAWTRSVADEVTAAFRVLLLGSALTLALTVALLTWLMNSSEPRVAALDTAISAIDQAHVGLVDQETGLRGYLTTGQVGLLQPYHAGVAMVARADRRLANVTLSRAATADLLAEQAAERRWEDEWAGPALDPATRAGLLDSGGQVAADRAAAYFERGKSLFDAYRAANGVLTTRVAFEASRERTQRRRALDGFTAALLTLVAGSLVSGLRRRRRLRDGVVHPVAVLLETVHAVAAGDLRPPPPLEGPTDLMAVAEGLTGMTAALSARRTEADERQLAAQRTADRLRSVLAFAREVSGSLSPRYVLEALATTARAVAGGPEVRVWLDAPEVEHLTLAYDSTLHRKSPVPPARIHLGDGLVGRAAVCGRVCRPTDEDAGSEHLQAAGVALPLMVGSRVIGVLEVVGEVLDGDAEALSMLETVTAHAATAIEAARMYQQAQALSVSDALTGLANRRSLDQDLTLEVERAVRYAHPVALIMVDLDHFKALNDTYGHPRGDQVLQQVARILTEQARSCDTVYRYGGEELAIIVRDSDLAAAQALAERLREGVATAFADGDGPAVTLSAGVAAVPLHAATPDGLLHAADRALYVAKREGRNRVAALAP